MLFISAPLRRRRLRMLEVRNLSVHHGRAQLLFDLSFSARAGEVLVLVGRNQDALDRVAADARMRSGKCPM